MSDDLRLPVEDFPDVDDGFGHWLAGLIDGEGSFSIFKRKTSPGFVPSFCMNLRDDDAPILHEVARRTGIGGVKPRASTSTPQRPNNNAQVVWEVRGLAGAQRLVLLLDRYPLRAKKARDYAVWRAAVQAWAELREERLSGPRGFRAVDWTRLEELQAELAETRAYRSAAWQ